MVKPLVPVAAEFYVTRAKYKGVSPRKLHNTVRHYQKNSVIVSDVKDAVLVAKKNRGTRPLVITGSIYVVSEAMPILKK